MTILYLLNTKSIENDLEYVVNAGFEISEKLIIEVDEKLLAIITSDSSQDVYLTVPDLLIMLLERAMILSETLYYGSMKMGKLSWLSRISIFPSADWAITLYHRDYAKTKENWMVVKLPISPMKVKDGQCERDIIFLNELIKTCKEQKELN